MRLTQGLDWAMAVMTTHAHCLRTKDVGGICLTISDSDSSKSKDEVLTFQNGWLGHVKCSWFHIPRSEGYESIHFGG